MRNLLIAIIGVDVAVIAGYPWVAVGFAALLLIAVIVSSPFRNEILRGIFHPKEQGSTSARGRSEQELSVRLKMYADECASLAAKLLKEFQRNPIMDLEEGIRMYGWHLPDCASLAAVWLTDKGKPVCDCGFDRYETMVAAKPADEECRGQWPGCMDDGCDWPNQPCLKETGRLVKTTGRLPKT